MSRTPPPPLRSTIRPPIAGGRHPGQTSGEGRRALGRLGLMLILIAALALAYRFVPGSDAKAARGDHAGASATAAGAPQDPTLERRLTLPGQGRFGLSLDAGDVDVTIGSGPDVVVSVTLSKAAQGDPSRVEWEIEESRDGARVALRSAKDGAGADGGKRGFWSLFGGHSTRTAAIDEVRLVLPPDASLELRTGAGDVSAGAVGGDVAIHSGAGDIQLAGTGGDLEIKIGAGDVEAAASGAATLNTGAGDVSLTAVGGPLTVRTGAGDIAVHLLDVQAPVDVKTGMGSIELVLPPGASASVNGKSGLGAVSMDVDGVSARSQGMAGQLDRQVGGGGPSVSLATGAGAVVVRQGGGAT